MESRRSTSRRWTPPPPDLKAIDVYESNSSAADTLEAMTAPLQNHGRQPEVISASLGLCEPAVYAAIGVHGIEATEAALEIAALSGVTFLASSGDSGSADCIGPNGFPIDRLAVNYPASSAWVTGVGGTNLLLGPANQITNQVVWNDTDIQPGSAAGGGSSAIFRRPFYQDGTLTAASRAVPDVSMLADIIPGYAVFCSAQGECVNSGNSNPWQSVGGTSASTPLLAGGFALVDQELRMHNRQDLGLANPLLYQLGRSSSLSGQVFDDTLSYGNDVGPFVPGNGQPLGCCTATRGYDRASGWGSVNIAGLAPLAVEMQPAQIGLSVPGGQKPIRSRQILARVSCTGPCRIGAYAVVTIAHKKPFRWSRECSNLEPQARDDSDPDLTQSTAATPHGDGGPPPRHCDCLRSHDRRTPADRVPDRRENDQARRLAVRDFAGGGGGGGGGGRASAFAGEGKGSGPIAGSGGVRWWIPHQS